MVGSLLQLFNPCVAYSRKWTRHPPLPRYIMAQCINPLVTSKQMAIYDIFVSTKLYKAVAMCLNLFSHDLRPFRV